MPHCLIEYDSPLEQVLDVNQLLETVHEAVSSSELFDKTYVRSRLQPFFGFRMGAEKSHFIHVTIKLMQGRSDKEKTELNQQVGLAIQALALDDVVLSCECVDIHTPSYYRALI